MARRTRVTRPIRTIMPNVLTTKLKFMDYYNMATGGAAAFISKPFRANGAYDPDASVGGGTPTGFNQLAAIYAKYRVLGSKITIWAYNTCASPIIVSVFGRSSTGSAPTSPTEVQQKSFEFGHNIRAKQLVPYGSGTGYPSCRLTLYRSTRALEGTRVDGEEGYSAPTSSNPALQTYWDVNLCSLDGAAFSSTANYTISITYYVRFSEMSVAYTD